MFSQTRFLLTISIFCTINIAFCRAQQKIHVSGVIKDTLSGESLIGANIIDIVSGKGTVTDYNGYFNLIVNPPVILKVSYIGYMDYLLRLESTKNSLLIINMKPGSELQEVAVVAQQKNQVNIATLSNNELLQIPSVTGKPDISRSLQLLPGISSQNEASSSLLVRGGDPGQNLYLFDNVPVIYVNHLGGFMSVFNPDIINKIDVYKGGFPSKFGGRLSSIVNITQKEGDISRLKGSFSVGLTDLSFAMEGPLNKKKNLSFILAGRKTLTEPFMLYFSGKAGDYMISYGFHDINGKVTYKPNAQNSLSLNIYQGDDYLKYKSSDDIDGKDYYQVKDVWGNWLISGNWKCILSPKLYVSNNFSYGKYRLKNINEYNINEIETYSNEFISSVENYSLYSDWKYKINEYWNIDFGFQSLLTYHQPNKTRTTAQLEVSNTPKIMSNESSLYLSNHIDIFDFIQTDIGLRLTNYITDDFSKLCLEPRLNFEIGIGRQNNINLSYMKVNQFSHLLFTSGNISNNEIWIPANNYFAPSFSRQYTLGWQTHVSNQNYSLETNLYYKELSALSTYKNGYTNLKGDTDWKSKVETGGSGVSSGLELLVKKKYGDLTGFMSYTFSKTTRKYPGINEGVEYPYSYDRPHSFSFNASYKINEKLRFSLTWVYQTGLPYTPAVGRQTVRSIEPDSNGNPFYYDALIYGDINSARLKDYHRLDLGLQYSKQTKRKNNAVWTFSIYNAYNSHNVHYYYYNNSDSETISNPEWSKINNPLQLYQVSYFPIIPNISYRIYFNNDNKQTKNKTKLKNWLYHDIK